MIKKKIHLNENKFLTTPKELQQFNNKQWNWYNSFYNDGHNNLWFNNGVDNAYSYNAGQSLVTNIRPSINGKQYSSAIVLIGLDQNNVLLQAQNDFLIYNIPDKTYAVIQDTGNYSHQINAIAKDEKGNVWFARGESKLQCTLSKLNIATKQIVNYTHPILDKIKYGNGRNSRALVTLKDNTLLYGASFGLFLVKVKNEKLEFTQISKRGNFFFDIEDILKQNDSIAWVRTKDYVFRMNYHTMFLSDYTNFGFNSANVRAMDLSQNGKLALGYRSANFKIVETKFIDSIKNNTLVVNEIIVDNIPITNVSNSIKLKYTTKDITLLFSSLDFKIPDLQYYKYKLEGYNNSWQESDVANVTYSNLASGTYRFILNGCNSYGIWNAKPIVMEIIISTPFWKSWWFILSSILSLLYITYKIVQYRIESIRKDELLKQSKLKSELKAMQVQMNPHFIFNCMNTLDAYILSNKKQEASSILQRFSLLTRLVLENSKSEFIKVEKEIQTLKNYIALEQEVLENKFDYDIDYDQELCHYEIPNMMIQPLVENAILHGLRHMDEKGSLQLKIYEKENRIVFEICDDGIGFEKSNQLKSYSITKTSIGLDNIKERIDFYNKTQVDYIRHNIEHLEKGTKILMSFSKIYNS